MEWFAADTCTAATSFGWLVGAASGLYAVASIILLIALAAPYDIELRRNRNRRCDQPLDERARARSLRRRQWMGFHSELLGPVLLWIGGAWHAGMANLDCYVWSMALGAFIPLGTGLAVFILGAARLVGSASAR
jgi:hypothetical protein